MDLIDSKQIEGDASAHDVGDGIDCAYLVEVNLFNRNAVDLRFGRAEPAENSGSVLLGALGDRRPGDQFEDMRKMTMGGRGAVDRDAKFGRGNAAPGSLRNLESRAGIETSKRIEKRFR